MSSIRPENVNELKRKLATDKDIAGVMQFFFDRFVDRPGFLSLGHAVEVPENLKEAMLQGLAAAFGKTRMAIEWAAVDVPEMQILHGTIIANGCPGAILWASDIQTGIVSVPKKGGSSEMFHIRLSVTPPRNKRTVN